MKVHHAPHNAEPNKCSPVLLHTLFLIKLWTRRRRVKLVNARGSLLHRETGDKTNYVSGK